MGKRLFIIIAITATILISCSKKPLQWDVDVSAPLLKTELTIANLLPDSMIETNEDHSLSVILNKELFSVSPASIAEFPDSLFEFALNVPQNSALAPGMLFFYKDELQKLAIAPVELNYVRIFSGDLTFNVINPFDKPIELTYKLPSATKDGVAFDKTLIIPPGNTSGTSYTANLSMAGYTFDLRGPDANTCNRFMTRMTARIANSSTDSAHSIHENLFIKIRFKNIVLDFLKGYFGNVSTSYGPESIQTDIFKNITGGSLQLDKCTAKFEIENGFGADAQLQLQSIKAVNSTSGKEVTLQSSLINNPINITRATETGSGVSVIPNKATLDFSASNITDLLTAFPDRFEYAAKLQLNPLGNISSGNDFAYLSHPFAVKLHFNLPLKFSAQNLTLQKSIAYNLSGKAADINSATLHLIADNSFPLSAAITLHIENQNGDAILEIPHDGTTIAAATLLQDGETETKHTIINFKLNEEQTKVLKDNKMMRVTVVFNTPANQPVNIYDTYKIDMKITADFNYGVSINN